MKNSVSVLRATTAILVTLSMSGAHAAAAAGTTGSGPDGLQFAQNTPPATSPEQLAPGRAMLLGDWIDAALTALDQGDAGEAQLALSEAAESFDLSMQGGDPSLAQVGADLDIALDTAMAALEAGDIEVARAELENAQETLETGVPGLAGADLAQGAAAMDQAAAIDQTEAQDQAGDLTEAEIPPLGAQAVDQTESAGFAGDLSQAELGAVEGDLIVAQAVEGAEAETTPESAEGEASPPAEAAEAAEQATQDQAVEEPATEAQATTEVEATTEAETTTEAEATTEAETTTEAPVETEAQATTEAPVETEAQATTEATPEAEAATDAEATETQATESETTETQATEAEATEAETQTTTQAEAEAEPIEEVTEEEVEEATSAGEDVVVEDQTTTEDLEMQLEELRQQNADLEAQLTAEPTDTQEELLTEETARTATEEVIARDDDDGSNVWKYLGSAAAGAAVGALVPALAGRLVQNQGDRVIVERGGDFYIRSDENALLRQAGTTVQTEEFAGGITRTTVTREDGSRIVTVRNPGGFILRRTRIAPDGQEIVLLEQTPEEVYDFQDWASTIPQATAHRQVVEYRTASTADLQQALTAEATWEPEQAFPLQAVRDSEQVRELVPAVDLPINFATGSAAIRPAEIEELTALGRMMESIIDQNPREIFLVEGHTDAVGSNLMNLALSDRRAESVALALTEYFDVPPENLVVQGYGERYLKEQTEGPSETNRRATVRRITPLIDRVASR